MAARFSADLRADSISASTAPVSPRVAAASVSLAGGFGQFAGQVAHFPQQMGAGLAGHGHRLLGVRVGGGAAGPGGLA